MNKTYIASFLITVASAIAATTIVIAQSQSVSPVPLSFELFLGCLTGHTFALSEKFESRAEMEDYLAQLKANCEQWTTIWYPALSETKKPLSTEESIRFKNLANLGIDKLRQELLNSDFAPSNIQQK